MVGLPGVAIRVNITVDITAGSTITHISIIIRTTIFQAAAIAAGRRAAIRPLHLLLPHHRIVIAVAAAGVVAHQEVGKAIVKLQTTNPDKSGQAVKEIQLQAISHKQQANTAGIKRPKAEG